MGLYDAQPWNPISPTPTLGALAAEGITLQRHYTYLYCSPTRRSFLTGRYPVHISGTQADICSDWTPLGMTLLSGKLAQAGFVSHFIGKTNIGFQTDDHMPIRRGFKSHVGFLYGAEDYMQADRPLYTPPRRSLGVDAVGDSLTSTGPGADGSPSCKPYTAECIPELDLTAHHTASFFTKDFWQDDAPAPAEAAKVFYSTNYYTDRTLAVLREHAARPATRAAERLWIHLCYQAVHSPFEEPPAWERAPRGEFWDQTYGDMLRTMDRGLHNITQQLRVSGLWNDTLIVIFSDNGGPSSPHGPNNYPLRGGKETPWEGGTRVAAMVSGGHVPTARRGTESHAVVHVADWFTTLSHMVGVDPTDKFDGEHDVDGIDVWPLLMANATDAPHGTSNVAGAVTTYGTREFLPISEQSIIWRGRWKYFSDTLGGATLGHGGWSTRNATLVPPGAADLKSCKHCLFDLLNDPQERSDVAALYPNITQRLAARLATYAYYTNASMSAEQLASYDCAPLKDHAADWPASWPWTVMPQASFPVQAPGQRRPPQPWRFDTRAAGTAVLVAADGLSATWDLRVEGGCDQVALLTRASSATAAPGPTTFWVELGDEDQFAYVGFCAPDIDKRGTTWVGWLGQAQAWVYREDGLFKDGTGKVAPLKGAAYGSRFGRNANVTGILHSATHVEFLVNGTSQGNITATVPLPADAYHAMVSILDDNVANITAELKHKDMFENTLIVFS
eukprot:g7816.t1